MTKGSEKNLGSDGYMFIILTVVVLSQVYTYVKI